MLKDHLKRTVRMSRPTLSSPPKRKGIRWIVYIFFCIVMVIFIALLLGTYESSINQPNIGGVDIERFDDIIIDRNDSVSVVPLTTKQDPNHDVSTQMEAWPLVTTNGPHCNAIFGNGFLTEPILSCSADVSQFECFKNPFSHQMYCKATNFILNPTMIKLSNGGEEIPEVAGRREDAEYPKFTADINTGDIALNVDCTPKGNIPKKDGTSYYLHDMITFMQHNDMGNANSKYHEQYRLQYDELCLSDHGNKITIFLLTMRYEYANMYHQATDWYNFYQIIHSLGIQNNYDIVFLDGHAKSQIDAAWKYGINADHYHFIKQINNGQPICLRNAIFVSAGYVGGISLQTVFKGCKKESKYVQGFGKWFLGGFGIETETKRKENEMRITLICRKDYVAHPRNLVGKATRKFGNIEAVMSKIEEAVRDVKDIRFNISSVSWSDYSFREQLQIAARTDILIGVHGAGLSHVLYLPPKSGLIEIVPMGYEGEPHFGAFADWNGHAYNRIRGGSEKSVNPDTAQLRDAIRNQVNFVKNNV